MKLAQTLFSFNGTIQRGKFALFMLPIVFTNLFLNVMVKAMASSGMGITQETLSMMALWFVISIYIGAALSIKRFHDIGKSGWNYLWLWIPFIGLYFLFVLLFKKSVEPSPHPQVSA